MNAPTDPAHAPATAMLLAAGRGNRMRPLTDHCPKPLLPLRGKPLMQWTMEAMAAAGVRRLVVNTGWLGDRIEAQIGPQLVAGDGQAPLDIVYSSEPRGEGAALETAGGIVRALPQLADVFWIAAGDVHAPGFVFEPAAAARFAASDRLAHLWLVPNPPHHPRGDFGIDAAGRATDPAADDAAPRYTYSTIGLYRRALFAAPYCALPAGNPHSVAAPLAPLLRAAIADGRVGATLFTGAWTDVGTPERLAELERTAG